MKNRKRFGSISILVLVFGVMFTLAIGGLVTTAAVQQNNAVRTVVFEQALTAAQAGAEYYRWHLAHNPADYKDGTNNPGPYVHPMSDPFGNTEATFSLMITPPATGSSNVTVTSSGWMNSYPSIKRVIVVKYGIPSLARYSFLNNASSWYGTGLTVYGTVMSNGGIRMDGTNTSTIQSALPSYTCGTETGCSPSTTKNGVWGAGGPSALWQFPVPATDFASLNINFNTMKTQAQSTGTYLAASGSLGYHVIFTNDGKYTIRKVTGATNRPGWSVENNCENLSQDITTESAVGTYTIAQKPLIFAEDNLWVDGIVNGDVTVVAARFPLNVNFMNIWITNNITYLAKDGHSNLGLFAQNNIYYGLNVPANFEIDAALLASAGHIIRHDYNYPGCSSYAGAVKNNLTIYGSVISNLKSYWNFGTNPDSGFTTRTINYDNNLYFNSPPYFPAQGTYQQISWSEQ